MLKYCVHPLCGYEGREEYCTERTRDPEGIPVIITEILDELLYDEYDLAADASWFSSDEKMQYAARTLSYLALDDRLRGTWPIRTEIQLSHTRNKRLGSEHYVVDTAWQPDHDSNTGEFHTRYCIDVYAQGNIQSLIEQPAYYGGYEERPMTPYDFEQLFAQLVMLQEIPTETTTDFNV